MIQYALVAENPESTVVAEYKPPYRKETAYQYRPEYPSSSITPEFISTFISLLISMNVVKSCFRYIEDK
jgi:hypothetical protein